MCVNNNICNGCKYLEKELEYYGMDTLPFDYYTFYCNNTRSNYRKAIEYYVEEGELVPRPKWCQLQNGKTQTCFDVVRNKDFNFKPNNYLCKWDDIKVGQLYHLPPINKQKRKNLKVTYANNYCATFEIINPCINDNKFITIYYTDSIAKFLVKIRDVKNSFDDLPF